MGVAAAIFHYTKAGYTVCLPATDAARYDLIVDDGLKLQRVQVKSTGHKTEAGSYKVQLATQGGNRSGSHEKKYITADECDLLFVYALDGTMYQMPVDMIAGMGNICLGKKWDEYKTTKENNDDD